MRLCFVNANGKVKSLKYETKYIAESSASIMNRAGFDSKVLPDNQVFLWLIGHSH